MTAITDAAAFPPYPVDQGTSPETLRCSSSRSRRTIPPCRDRDRRTLGRPAPPLLGDRGKLDRDGRRRAADCLIEFYPRGTELREAPGDADACGLLTGAGRHGPTHAAIGTQLGRRCRVRHRRARGWPAKYRKRGGVFGVIELWMEGCQMIEGADAEMRHEYRGEGVTMENWERFWKRQVEVAALALIGRYAGLARRGARRQLGAGRFAVMAGRPCPFGRARDQACAARASSEAPDR